MFGYYVFRCCAADSLRCNADSVSWIFCFFELRIMKKQFVCCCLQFCSLSPWDDQSGRTNMVFRRGKMLYCRFFVFLDLKRGRRVSRRCPYIVSWCVADSVPGRFPVRGWGVREFHVLLDQGFCWGVLVYIHVRLWFDFIAKHCHTKR